MNATTIGLEQVRPARHAQQARRRPVRHSKRPTWVGPVLWAVGLAIFVMAAGALPTARDSTATRTTSAIIVTVTPADTLWSIAANHRAPGASTADTVAAIVEVNSLDRRTVIAGTTLKVPTQSVSDEADERSAEAVATR